MLPPRCHLFFVFLLLASRTRAWRGRAPLSQEGSSPRVFPFVVAAAGRVNVGPHAFMLTPSTLLGAKLSSRGCSPQVRSRIGAWGARGFPIRAGCARGHKRRVHGRGLEVLAVGLPRPRARRRRGPRGSSRAKWWSLGRFGPDSAEGRVGLSVAGNQAQARAIWAAGGRGVSHTMGRRIAQPWRDQAPRRAEAQLLTSEAEGASNAGPPRGERQRRRGGAQ